MKIIILSLFMIISFACFFQKQANEKETVYLLFDKDNKEKCLIEDGSGNSKYFNKYRKEYWENGNIIAFKICDETFATHKAKDLIDTCAISTLAKVKLVDFDYIERKYDSLFEFKHHVFEKIYFIEKISADEIVKYEVNWLDDILMIVY